MPATMVVKMGKGFMNIQKLNFLLILTFLTLLSCREDDAAVQNLGELAVPVDEIIDLSDPDNQNLLLPNEFKYIDGGLRGIVVINRGNGEIVAFDRNCSYLPRAKCATITMHPSRSFLLDSCCSSQFTLNGLVKEIPASQPLLQYRTFFDGNQIRVVYP